MEMLYAHVGHHDFDAACPVGRDFHGAWCAIKWMQTMPGPTTCLHGELFGQNLQDRIRYLHERMSGQVITRMVRKVAIALSALLVAVAFAPTLVRDSRFRAPGVDRRNPDVSQQMIIEFGESVSLVCSDNAATDHSKTLANLGAQDAGPCR
jgi:hypothetical protein